MKKIFIGVDFSKAKFDVSAINDPDMSLLGHNSFDNTRLGCRKMMSWLKETTHTASKGWMFCGEHTGLYSVTLCTFLVSKKLFIWMENPMQIKLSSGVKRGKNDSADSLMIAQYAYRHRDKAKPYQLPEKDLHALNILMGYRRRLIENKGRLLVSANETRACYQRDSAARFIYERSMRKIKQIDEDVKECEAKMNELIQANESLKENYDLVTSIKGIALINAAALLITTANFTLFENSRQYACYAGLAPFNKESGTSIHTKRHVSKMANTKIKVLLTQAARCAIKFNPQMRAYYQRKIADGKNSWLVLNNVRNKLVNCAFALVKNKQPYQDEYINPMTVA
jgi:transposase